MTTVKDIQRTYSELPVGQRSHGVVRYKLHELGYEVSWREVRAALHPLIAAELRRNELRIAANVLRQVGELGWKWPARASNIAIELARKFTEPLAELYGDDIIGELRQSIALVLEWEAMIRDYWAQMDRLERMDALRQKAAASRSQTASSAESR